MKWGWLPCRRVEIMCIDTKITWWSYRCTNQLVHRASANSVVGKYVKHRDEEKQDKCLPKAASFAGVLWASNRWGWVQSDFSGAEHNTDQVWSWRAVWFSQSAWIWAALAGKTTQLPAQSWTTSPSSEVGRKNYLVCSIVQRDAEIISARANFQPELRLKGDLFSTSYASTTWGLSLVCCWYIEGFADFILTVPQEKSTSALCNHIHFHLAWWEEKQDTISTCIKTMHPKLPSPHSNPGACEPTDSKPPIPMYDPQKITCVQIPMLGKPSRHSQQLPEIIVYPTRLQTTIRKQNHVNYLCH